MRTQRCSGVWWSTCWCTSDALSRAPSWFGSLAIDSWKDVSMLSAFERHSHHFQRRWSLYISVAALDENHEIILKSHFIYPCLKTFPCLNSWYSQVFWQWLSVSASILRGLSYKKLCCDAITDIGCELVNAHSSTLWIFLTLKKQPVIILRCLLWWASILSQSVRLPADGPMLYVKCG